MYIIYTLSILILKKTTESVTDPDNVSANSFSTILIFLDIALIFRVRDLASNYEKIAVTRDRICSLTKGSMYKAI